MELKQYQRRVVEEVERYLAAVAKQREAGNLKHAALDAWCGLGSYRERKNGLGEDLPTFCIKVPTGGGKTLLATQILGSIHRTLLKERNGAGLVLWVVPSNQIYRDTLRRLRDRNDLYRLMLEHAVSRRLEVWEKHEIARLSPTRLRECLNILVLQLASTNRETQDQLKFFRDSGGNVVQHFPPEDDPAGHKALKAGVPNLDMVTGELAKTSIGNLVRLCRPPVILDEGHKATSELARATIEGFNASVVVELSATPLKGTNIVSKVTGKELLDEQMIKLPLNIATSGQKSWQNILTQARDRRKALERKAAGLGPDRRIRPLVLVQVERTGKDQRDTGHIHSEDVKTYLIERLGVSPAAIAIKSSETDDIEGIDLLDPGCAVEWIITKSALQEGWDCPFAYILASLNNTGSGQGMTQLVGRILRQPYQERTPFPELNESTIYCLHEQAGEVARQVKAALEKEGYEGDAFSTVVDASGGVEEAPKRTAVIRPEFSRFYKPFEGKIYLPHFSVKEDGGYRALDYFEHLVARVDVKQFAYGEIDWPLADDLKAARDRFYRISIGTELTRHHETESDLIEPDEQVLGWLAAGLRFDFLGHKQLRFLVRRVYDRLRRTEPALDGKLALVKFQVRDRIERFAQEEVDEQTEAAFRDLFDAGRIRFHLECAECRFEIPSSVTVQPTRPLMRADGTPVQHSLFDYVEHESQNEYERAVALCLDQDANVLWWYRNLVGPEHFTVQGYRRHRIRPDFVVQGAKDGKPEHRVLVVESKGKHLEGNPDTTYKRKVADYFEKAGKKVAWQKLGADFKDHVFRFQILDEAQPRGRDWKDELRDLLAGRA